jgi:hypothetical protein
MGNGFKLSIVNLKLRTDILWSNHSARETLPDASEDQSQGKACE